MPPDADPAAVTVVPYPGGPLVLRGDFALRAMDGTPIGTHGQVVALCRCGRSSAKPFCDGSHKSRRRGATQLPHGMGGASDPVTSEAGAAEK
ncbi:MAG: Iron sulfur-containing domain, CDGSH-type [Pseudonocardiales bacterium]|nr:Iron sulfur-containing domain, CDGSH-type [Pseudonocardiales bacterium]